MVPDDEAQPEWADVQSREEILAECATVGVRHAPVALYCFQGARASNTLVALKKPHRNDSLFGSWNEWSRDPSLRIETGLPYKTSAAPSVAA